MNQRPITQLINEIEQGDQRATDSLFELLYSQLKQLANRQLRGDQSELQATSLVHEAFIRLLGSENPSWENRRHFFGAAAQAMRRILIDFARTRSALKRGGDRLKLTLCESLASTEDRTGCEELLDLHAAICELEQEDPALAKIVELRFFAGQSMADIANLLDTSLSSIERKWRLARAFLVSRIESTSPDSPDSP